MTDTSYTPEDWIRKYKFDFPGIIYNGKNITEEDVKSDLLIYFRKILTNEAGNDTYTYPKLQGTDYADPSVRAMYFYRQLKLKTYRIDFPNP